VLGGPSLPLVRLFGIRIGVNVSWFLVLFLAIFWLSDLFRDALPDRSDTVAYGAAVAMALLFFGSILLHEVGHAVAARREGIEVAGIDLFFFGGVMKMSRDTDSPGAEFRVAVAGPLVTLAIVGLCAAAGAIADAGGFWDSARTDPDVGESVPLMILGLLGAWNAILLAFNLIPAFPLDGGRIARAAIWKFTGSRERGTKIAAQVGQGFAFVLIGIGIAMAVTGDTFDGIWLAVLGWLLGSSARAAVVQTAVQERLRGITVADIMDAEPVTVPAALPAARAYEDYFLRYQGWPWFAVVEDDGHYAGVVHRAAVQHAVETGDEHLPIRSLAGGEADARVQADAPLEALLGSEALRRNGALMAVDPEGRLRGVVTLEQVSRALQARLAPSG
jgi:Zn-dependent protease